MAQAFISWSGTQARSKAKALRKLLEDVLPEAKVFMSDEDISAGSLWLTSISGSLDESVAGVIMVTAENLRNPWVHYEAGALATRVESRMVIPLLNGLSPSDLASTPLSVFQALVLDKSAVLEVCTSFAGALGITRGRDVIGRSFEKWWGEYREELLSLPEDLAKPPIGLDDIYRLVSDLQAQLRSQMEMLTSLTQGLDASRRSQIMAPRITPPAVPVARYGINPSMTTARSASSVITNAAASSGTASQSARPASTTDLLARSAKIMDPAAKRPLKPSTTATKKK